MIARAATFPAMGVDTILKLTKTNCAALKAAGVRYVIRYLGGLTPTEVSTILTGGLALMVCTYSRGEGWVPTAALGTADGKKSVAQAKELGLPPNTTIWLDLEGCRGPASATTAWVNAWAVLVQAAGYVAGLYVGAAPGGLTPATLWKLKVTRYWHSLSRVPDVDRCGYCMYQLYPPNVKVGGVQVDVDFVQHDFLGRAPTWVEQS